MNTVVPGDHKRRNVRTRTFEQAGPAKIQISLRSRAVWSESSQGAFWIDKDATFLHADNEDCHQTARMRSLGARGRRYACLRCAYKYVEGN